MIDQDGLPGSWLHQKGIDAAPLAVCSTTREVTAIRQKIKVARSE